jgi:hypothetical protein
MFVPNVDFNHLAMMSGSFNYTLYSLCSQQGFERGLEGIRIGREVYFCLSFPNSLSFCVNEVNLVYK